MRRLTILCASAAVTAVPAVFGLAGNPSFSQSVPVQVPSQVKAASVHTATPRPVVKHTEPGDDRGKHAEPGDDRGTDTPRAVSVARPAARSAAPTHSPAALPVLTPATTRVDDHGVHPEPGDDRGVHPEASHSTTGNSGKGRGGHDDAPGDK